MSGERETLFASEGLPPDLVDALRKYGHLIPASRTLNLVIGATEAPCATASAMTNEEWMHAWVAEWQRANRAEADLEEKVAALKETVASRREILRNAAIEREALRAEVAAARSSS